jgi:hypothetical protein
LRTRARQGVDGVQEARGKSTVVHGLGSLYLTEFFRAMRRLIAAFVARGWNGSSEERV